MNNKSNKFERILQKFALRQPMPVKIQNYILDYKRTALMETLKEFGEYNIIYGYVLRLYYLSQRLGIGLSVAKAKVALALLSLIVVVILTTGILLYAYFPNNNIEPLTPGKKIKNVYTDKIETQKPVIIKHIKKKIKKNDLSFRLGIKTFNGKVVDKNVLNNITVKIAGELIKARGSDRIVELSKVRKRRNVNLLLTGSVEKLGSTYIVSAKVIDVERSGVVFVTDEIVDNIDMIDNACSKIAERVDGKLKQLRK